MTNILQLAGVTVSQPLSIATNADFRGGVVLASGGAAVDITGISFFMQVRGADLTAIWLALSTANGLLINGGATGLLSWIVPASMTRLLQAYAGLVGVADLLAEADGVTLNLCGGTPLNVSIGGGITWP
jgi:hypothetical protein